MRPQVCPNKLGTESDRPARAAWLAGWLGLCVACGSPEWSEPGSALATWPFYGADAAGTRYSPADQIDRANVWALEDVWRVRTGDLDADPSPPAKMSFQATPIEVDGLLVLPTPLGRVLALDAETGRERWRFTTTVLGDEYPEFTSRGVAAWRDPERASDQPCAATHLCGDGRIPPVRARRAERRAVSRFRGDGEVNLREGVGARAPRDYATSSPPVVAGDLVIIGSAIGDNQRVDAPLGIVRAFSARSGALVWSWDPIPRDARDPAYAGWDPEAARRTGAANAWAPLSLDAFRDLLFVPTSSPSPDYYGGERPGDNRYANSVVALRASSGELVWHFQTVHHDLWDYDVSAQPTLASVRRDGVEIPVVIQATKMGYIFVLHRETGEPVFPVEERAVPASDVPGEYAWPTQPVPLRPRPIVPQSLAPEQAWGITPWDRGRCREWIARLRNEGLFTPPSLKGTLALPGIAGGVNWGGLAIDPERRIIVSNATNLAFEVRLIPRADFAGVSARRMSRQEVAPQLGTPFGMLREPIVSPLGLPCTPPPWGTLTALSLDSGEILWQRPLGSVPDAIPVPLPIHMGLPNLGGPLVTAGGLVFIAASMDGMLRAFDIESGEERWSDRLPAGGNATPMTYRLRPDGRQILVLAAGGHGKLGTRRGDSVLAYALPRRAD